MSMVCKTNGGFLPKHRLSVAFYNLDNLFDDVDDLSQGDDEFSPKGKYKWTKERYQQKLNNMARVISGMVDGHLPDAMGVCELESSKALSDLIGSGALNSHYRFVHQDSPDERGIDVGFIYNPEKLKVIDYKSLEVKLSKDSTDRTRDILQVNCLSLTGDSLTFFVCHFPSRREGKDESEQNRLDAASVLQRQIEKTAIRNYIILGDFNDQPKDKSIKTILKAENFKENPSAGLFNLMYELPAETPGSYFYRGHWEKLDQIMISRSLRNLSPPDYEDASVKVMKKDWMIQRGKFEGYPLRTFGGDRWLNGYSDHLPVYMILSVEKDGKN